MSQTFFYDSQIRRFLLQFARMFSHFQVEFGRNETGQGPENTLITVPVRYGDASRQAQTIIQENSANKMPSTPLMTFYIASLDYDRARVQEPYHVDRIQVRERRYDTETDSYETTQGNAFTIERLMPVPYQLTINLDIWTSNTNQKMQILEQLMTLFNPAMEIQSTDNFIDWTSLSVCELTKTSWSSRIIPQGTENPIDISTMTFVLPIWISAPAKIKKLGVVERIVMSIYDAQGDASLAVTNNDLLMGTRLKVTPYDYQVALLDGQLQILKATAVIDQGIDDLAPFQSPVDQQVQWPPVIDMYGVLRPGISYVSLDNPWNPDQAIVGTVSVNPADDRFLLFVVDADTLPANTLAAVDAVIDPLISGPGDGLDSSITGQRYLLTQDTGADINNAGPVNTNPPAWRGTGGQPLVARANDIIEYDGQRWRVMFAAETQDQVQYVTNVTTGIQYRWNPATAQEPGYWAKSYDGLYAGGSWTLTL